MFSVFFSPCKSCFDFIFEIPDFVLCAQHVWYRAVIWTLSNTYDGASRKQWTTFSLDYFRKKCSIKDIWRSPKYNTVILSFLKFYFSNKGSNSNKITLVENHAIITNYRVNSKTMNKFFINTTKKLNLKPFKSSSDIDINQITSVFKNHVSITKIQECFVNIEANDFYFRQVSLKEVKLEILNLNINKSSTKGSIPATIFKKMCRYLPSVLNKCNKQTFFR